jgi:hypothetical protein
MGKDAAGINQSLGEGWAKPGKERLRLAYDAEGVWTGAMVVFCPDPSVGAHAETRAA